jgi:hypothetical protein
MAAWTFPEINALVAAQAARLQADQRAAWQRCAVQPFFVPWHRVSCQLGGDEIWVLARAGERVLVYDCVADEYGAGRLDEFGVLRDFDAADADFAAVLLEFDGAAAPRLAQCGREAALSCGHRAGERTGRKPTNA